MHDTISSCLRDASLAPTRLSLVTIEPSSRVRWARCQRESSAGACTTSVYLLRCDANRDARNGEATGLQTCKYLRRLHVVTRTPTLLFGRSAASLSVLDLLPPRQTWLCAKRTLGLIISSMPRREALEGKKKKRCRATAGSDWVTSVAPVKVVKSLGKNTRRKMNATKHDWSMHQDE